MENIMKENYTPSFGERDQLGAKGGVLWTVKRPVTGGVIIRPNRMEGITIR
jgi:hypothetical protein